MSKESIQDLELKLKDRTDKLDEMTKRFKDQEEKSLSIEEELKIKVQQSLKDIALKEQKVQFVEIQLIETQA